MFGAWVIRFGAWVIRFGAWVIRFGAWVIGFDAWVIAQQRGNRSVPGFSQRSGKLQEGFTKKIAAQAPCDSKNPASL